MLYSSYSASAEYMVEASDKYLEGSFELLRSDKTTISFTSPDEYSSISISGDSSGQSDVLAFELHGIPANVPKSIASDLSLVFSLFSDEIPSKIMTLDENCFTLYEDDGSAAVSFSENGTSYSIIYSTATGIPLAINASDENSSVSITIKDLEIS